jgi:hypothetical protein
MFVDRVLIIRIARITCVSNVSRTCGMRPVRFFDTLSSGEKDVPRIDISMGLEGGIYHNFTFIPRWFP